MTRAVERLDNGNPDETPKSEGLPLGEFTTGHLPPSMQHRDFSIHGLFNPEADRIRLENMQRAIAEATREKEAETADLTHTTIWQAARNFFAGKRNQY